MCLPDINVHITGAMQSLMVSVYGSNQRAERALACSAGYLHLVPMRTQSSHVTYGVPDNGPNCVLTYSHSAMYTSSYVLSYPNVCILSIPSAACACAHFVP